MGKAYRNSAHAELGGNAQDKILEGYIARFKLTGEEGWKLHMFFSPTRIPKGLTENEVREVLKLSPKRDARRRQVEQRLRKEAGYSVIKLPDGRKMKVHNPPSFYKSVMDNMLPVELMPGRMTRRAFQAGMTKLRENLATR